MIGPRLKDLGRWYSGGTPPSEAWQYWDGDVPWLSGKDFDKVHLRAPVKYTTAEGARRFARAMPGGRSILVLVRGMALAHGLPIARLPYDAAISQDVRGLVVDDQFDPDFVYYWLVGHRPNLDVHIDRAAHGTARARDTLYAHRMSWLPDRQTQREVADFLDRECMRISEASEALVRAASAAVCVLRDQADRLFTAEGSSPTRLMAVLAQRPAYGVLVPKLVDDGVPFIRVGDLQDLEQTRGAGIGRIPPAQSDEYQRTVVDPGDVLVSVVGSIDKSAVVPDELAGANVARAVARLRPRGISSRVLQGWTTTRAYAEQARIATLADTAQPTLNIGDLAKFSIKVPADMAGAERALDAIETRRASVLTRRMALGNALDAYNSSLIFEAVTGKLDPANLSEAQMDERLHAAAENVPDEATV